MQPLMRFPSFGGTEWAGTPLEMFTTLECLIGILQVAGACFNLLKGAKVKLQQISNFWRYQTSLDLSASGFNLPFSSLWKAGLFGCMVRMAMSRGLRFWVFITLSHFLLLLPMPHRPLSYDSGQPFTKNKPSLVRDSLLLSFIRNIQTTANGSLLMIALPVDICSVSQALCDGIMMTSYIVR